MCIRDSRDAGRMLWQGCEAAFRTPAEAAAAGIAMVHQESLLAPHLTVAENIFLGREERLPFGWVHRRRMIERAARIIEEHHFPLHADWRVERLSPAGKQLVGICRAIQHGSSLLIFDEPTSSLSGAETEEVFRIVRTLRARGMGVIYICLLYTSQRPNSNVFECSSFSSTAVCSLPSKFRRAISRIMGPISL